MEKLTASMRRLFGKKENDGVKRKSHPYDEIKVDKEGINVGEHDANEFQKAPQRATRSYEDVDLPVNAEPQQRAQRSYEEVDLPVNPGNRFNFNEAIC